MTKRKRIADLIAMALTWFAIAYVLKSEGFSMFGAIWLGAILFAPVGRGVSDIWIPESERKPPEGDSK